VTPYENVLIVPIVMGKEGVSGFRKVQLGASPNEAQPLPSVYTTRCRGLRGGEIASPVV